MRTLWSMREGAVTALLLALLASPPGLGAIRRRRSGRGRFPGRSVGEANAEPGVEPHQRAIPGKLGHGIGDREGHRHVPQLPPSCRRDHPEHQLILRVIMPLASQPAADALAWAVLATSVMSAFFSPAASAR